MSIENIGLINPHRVRQLIKETISFLKLDLSGLTILTEAASGNYIVTPIIAAAAGAEVYAVTANSHYGKADDVRRNTFKFADFCGVGEKIKVVYEKRKNIIGKADIVTNLGFVRPINAEFVSMMKKTAVVPYMYEAWEYRDGDVDIEACKSRGIPVAATDERAMMPVFDYCGNLCAKMLFMLDIEIYESKIAIVSRDRFGDIIKKSLGDMGAKVCLISDLKADENRSILKGVDVLIIADYMSDDLFIGSEGAQISAKKLTELSQKVSIIQFSGDVDIEELLSQGIPYLPKNRLGSHKMGMTLAFLGPKPVIDLHSSGLKVGEAMARARLEGMDAKDSIEIALKRSPAQELI